MSGINTAVAGGANGIGFAVPIDDAAEIMAAAIGATAELSTADRRGSQDHLTLDLRTLDTAHSPKRLTEVSMEQFTPVTPVEHSRRPLALPLIWIVVVAVVAMIAVVAAATGSPRTLNAGSNGTPNGALAAAASPEASGAAASPKPSGAPDKAGGEGWKAGGGLRLGIGGRGAGLGRITITAIDGSQLSLRTDNGWTRTIDASNAEVYRGETEIALSDLQVGDQILFREVRTSNGSTTITRIQVLDPSVRGDDHRRHRLLGDCRAAGRHQPTIQTTSSTTYALGRETVTRDQALVAGQPAPRRRNAQRRHVHRDRDPRRPRDALRRSHGQDRVHHHDHRRDRRDAHDQRHVLDDLPDRR